ncbi:hypothetical protein O181_070471 [Austropuccinia psidii MF-1]|uniref:Uncharacterized protein n=1 Tax=Austropuccinia psidii MF-1 TaxID=1389203 RepID=A0A9Q3I5P5_9BASI|nr:hypothetical protein [Austropuccinia psidii MF-1]
MPVGSTPPLSPSPCVSSPFTSTPVPSPEIPPIAPENPDSSSPHSHDEARQEFTDDSLSHHPQINQPNLVGASPISPHDFLCGCGSSK